MKGGAEDGRIAGIHRDRCVGSRNGIQDQRRNLVMESRVVGYLDQGSLLVATVCNADLCREFPKIKKLRESITVEQATWLQEEHNKASHE